MAVSNRPKTVPPTSTDPQQWQRTAQTAMQEINKGNINCTGQVTLTANSATTQVNDPRAGPTSHIGFMPLTYNGAQEKRRLIVQSQGNGYFLIGHTNNAIADRTYRYSILG